MRELFTIIMGMSITASIVILAVVLIRLPLKKVPKWISYALWAVVAFRLVCPFAIESRMSAIPAGVNTAISAVITESEQEIRVASRQMQTMISGDKSESGAFRASFRNLSVASSVLYYGAFLWPIGIGIMLLRGLIQTLRLKRRLYGSSEIEPGLFETDLKTPFLFGVLHPKIYVPAELSGDERRYVILHERTHLRRCDHLVKFGAYLILCLHWFNPLVWLAFLLMGADMEMSCDERVLEELGGDMKKAYSHSLLSLASERRNIVGSPVAFGEGGVKVRIKNVLSFRRPSRLIVMASIIVVAALSVGFAVDRAEKITETDDNPMATQILDYYSSDETIMRGAPAIQDGKFVMINAGEVPQAQSEEQRNVAAENAVTLYLDEKKSEYGVIDLQTGFVAYSSSETQRVFEQWRGSDAATQKGWTDEYLAANLAIVYAEYTVEYDNTKVSTEGGDIRCYFYLIRDIPDSDYRIWTVSYDVGDSHSRMP